MKTFSPTNSWFCYCLLLISFFLVKSIVYMSVVPPFEGWDEYQHLAYMTYLDEHDSRPIMNNSFVSRKLLEEIVSYPVPDAMHKQTGATGAMQYIPFFARGEKKVVYTEDHPDVRLYQSQHGSLYYRLMLPVLHQFQDEKHTVNALFAMRAINIGFICLSLVIILWFINKTVSDKRFAGLLGFLIVCQPLLLINSVRVSNDGFAILTGTIVVVMGLLSPIRTHYGGAILAGVLIGLSCWTKSTSLVLVPFWFCCLFLSYLSKDISLRRFFSLTVVCYLSVLLVMLNYFLSNLENYGLLFVMQEAIINKQNGVGLVDVIDAVVKSDLFSDLYDLWAKQSIWVGGWSLLRVHNIRNIAFIIISISLLSWFFRLFFKDSKTPLIPLETAFLCFLFCFLTSLSVGWHYIQCVITWGVEGATSCPWYLCLGIPFFLIFVVASGHRWSPKVCAVLATALTGVYLYADLRGLVSMVWLYSGNNSGIQALQNLASIRPELLNTPVLVGSFVTFLVFGGVIISILNKLRITTNVS